MLQPEDRFWPDLCQDPKRAPLYKKLAQIWRRERGRDSELDPCRVGAKDAESGGKERQIRRPFHSHVQFPRIVALLKETGGLCISYPGLGRVARILSSCLIEVNIPTRVVHVTREMQDNVWPLRNV
jgi:hypothetical protein